MKNRINQSIERFSLLSLESYERPLWRSVILFLGITVWAVFYVTQLKVEVRMEGQPTTEKKLGELLWKVRLNR
jgi:hypothetical protein